MRFLYRRNVNFAAAAGIERFSVCLLSWKSHVKVEGKTMNKRADVFGGKGREGSEYLRFPVPQYEIMGRGA